MLPPCLLVALPNMFTFNYKSFLGLCVVGMPYIILCWHCWIYGIQTSTRISSVLWGVLIQATLSFCPRIHECSTHFFEEHSFSKSIRKIQLQNAIFNCNKWVNQAKSQRFKNTFMTDTKEIDCNSAAIKFQIACSSNPVVLIDDGLTQPDSCQWHPLNHCVKLKIIDLLIPLITFVIYGNGLEVWCFTFLPK